MDLRRRLPDLTADGWKRVTIRTLLITGITCCLAMGGTVFAKAVAGEPNHFFDFVVAVGLSILFGVPVIGWLSVTLEELRNSHRQLEIFAATDLLTGILSRGAFIERTEAHLRIGPDGLTGGSGSLLTIDVDNFKEVNDLYGHHWGDEALKLIVEACGAAIRSQDPIGRMGGEEFAIFLIDAEIGLALEIAERVRASVSQLDFRPHGYSQHLSISIGITAWRPGRDFTDLYRESDRQLYQAKKNGRNRVEFDRDAWKRTGTSG